MKTCSKCNLEKEPTEFYKQSRNKDGLQHQCKVCANSYMQTESTKAKYRIRSTNGAVNKAKTFAEFKATCQCVRCGENDPVCLDFHHTDPSTKFMSIVDMVRVYSWNRTKEEIAKCVCLCSNCHRKVHAGRFILPH